MNTKYNKKRIYKYDLEKYYIIQLGTIEPPWVDKLKLWIRDFGLHCVMVFRFGQFAEAIRKNNRVIGFVLKFIYYIFNYIVQLFHHVDIHLLADIGPGFFIAHASSIFIGPSKIGCNCSIGHNVTIGVGYKDGSEGIPTIGDNVWISTGSVLIGKIEVGDGVTITPCCFLSKSVPNGSLVGGNPGRVISRNFDNSYMLKYNIHFE